MGSPQTLTLTSFTGLASLNGVYSLGFAFLFGMSVWVSFFAGVIAYRALPRQQFGALQHRVFPVYFNLTILLSGCLLGLWTYTHPDVLAYATNPLIPDVAQAYTLVTVLVLQSVNSFVIGPMTSKTMFERHRQEKEEGKAYSDAGVSDAMKALNSKFAQLHGISSLANLGVILAVTFHGLWLGNHGLVPN